MLARIAAAATRRGPITLLVCMALLWTAGIAAAGPGLLDTTFGIDGKVITTFGSEEARASDVALQPDGKILVGGSYAYDFALARYNTDGSLDTTFDTDGKVTTDFGGPSGAHGVAIQPDGRIVAAGAYEGQTYSDPAVFALTRYNTDGSLDTTFDTDGKVTTDFASLVRADAVAIQTDGKIVAVGGALVARYNTDGSLDATFDTDGKVTTDPGGLFGAHGVAIQTDGKIVVAGLEVDADYQHAHFAVTRYNTDGSLDATFVATPGPVGEANAVAIQTDGKIVAAGLFDYGYEADYFGLVRYNTDGSLDTTFDLDGMAETRFNLNVAYGADDVVIRSDGKIVAAGSSSMVGGDFALARYNIDGSLDTTFDTDGMVTTEVGSGTSRARGVAIQPDGKIVAAGNSYHYSESYFALARYADSAPTSLTIKARSKVPAGTKVAITGTLSSPQDPTCMDAETVTLKKGATTAGTVSTSATGAYKFTLKIKRKTTVQVIYAETPACWASASPKKTIKVT